MKAMIKKSLVLLVLLWTGKAFGQQDPMYTNYVFNGLIINPAYAGTHDVLTSTLLYRNQWVNIPGAPKTGIFSLDAPWTNERVGLGLTVLYDKIGVSNRTKVCGAYSYKIELGPGRLSFGLQVGVGFNTAKLTTVKYTEGTSTDASFSENFNEVYPDFGLGLYYYTDRFYAGASIPEISGKAFVNSFSKKQDATSFNQINHYFLTAGYLFDITPDLKFKPSTLLKIVKGAPLELDINATTWFYDMFALGVSYRSLSSLNFFGQLKLTNQLSFGYAYEYAVTSMGDYSSGSHEVMLQYLFDFSHSKIVTPRFF